jgi:hypothetical protein
MVFKTYGILMIGLLLVLGSNSTLAQEEQSFKKFYAGLEMGAGWLDLTSNQLNEGRTARFALGLYGGYKPNRWLRIGINLNGWLIQPYNQFYFFYFGDEGISISNIYGQIQAFPIKKLPFFLNFQGGSSKYVNLNPDGHNAKGMGGKLGIGYDFPTFENLGFSLNANWGFGSFGDFKSQNISITDQKYNVFEILLGFSFR